MRCVLFLDLDSDFCSYYQIKFRLIIVLSRIWTGILENIPPDVLELSKSSTLSLDNSEVKTNPLDEDTECFFFTILTNSVQDA